MKTTVITAKNYKKEIGNYKNPVLLSFGGDGLTAFLLQQTVDSLSEELCGEIKVCVTSSSQLAKKYNIRFLPTTVLIQHGEVTDKILGNISRENFLKVLESN